MSKFDLTSLEVFVVAVEQQNILPGRAGDWHDAACPKGNLGSIRRTNRTPAVSRSKSSGSNDRTCGSLTSSYYFVGAQTDCLDGFPVVARKSLLFGKFYLLVRVGNCERSRCGINGFWLQKSLPKLRNRGRQPGILASCKPARCATERLSCNSDLLLRCRLRPAQNNTKSAVI